MDTNYSELQIASLKSPRKLVAKSELKVQSLHTLIHYFVYSVNRILALISAYNQGQSRYKDENVGWNIN